MNYDVTITIQTNELQRDIITFQVLNCDDVLEVKKRAEMLCKRRGYINYEIKIEKNEKTLD